MSRDGRIPDELGALAPAKVERAQRRVEVVDAPACGSAVRDHEGTNNAIGFPSSRLRDLSSQANFDVEPAGGVLEIPDASLALGDLQHTGAAMI